MAKRIQLVLSQDISKLGRSGDLVEVAPGYARNYLIPQKLAVNATRAVLKQVERRKEQERQRQLEQQQQAQELKTAIENVGHFTIAKQAGEGDSIFGSVTDREVATLIQEAIGQQVDRRGITLPDINKIGTYKAEIKLYSEVTAVVEIQVVPE